MIYSTKLRSGQVRFCKSAVRLRSSNENAISSKMLNFKITQSYKKVSYRQHFNSSNDYSPTYHVSQTMSGATPQYYNLPLE
jgi:hypothetical protein